MTASPNRDDRTVSGTILIVAWMAVIASLPASALDSPSMTPPQGAAYLGVITTVGITLVGTLWARGAHPHPVTDAQLHLVSVTLVGLALLAGIVGVAVLVNQAPEALSLDQLVVFGASVLFALVTSIGSATIPLRVSVDYRDRAAVRRRAHVEKAVVELARTSPSRAVVLVDLSLIGLVPAIVIAIAAATVELTWDVTMYGALIGVIAFVLGVLVLTLLAQFITHAWIWMLPTSAALLLLLSAVVGSLAYLAFATDPLPVVCGGVLAAGGWSVLLINGLRSHRGLRRVLLFVVRQISRGPGPTSSRRPSERWQAVLRLTGRI
jgi:hypothetical protein